MELGLSTPSSVSVAESPAETAEGIFRAASVAADAGIDFVQSGDHHLVGGSGYLQGLPILARMSADFDRIAPMFLLPVWDPVIVAEQLGTLSAFADVDAWFAVGRSEQVASMGIRPVERARRLEEGLTLIQRLFEEDDVVFEGDFYEVDGGSVNPKANPRIVIAGMAKPVLHRAGDRGDAWVGGASCTQSQLIQRIEWLQETGDADIMVRRDALVLPDGHEAREVSRRLLDDGYRGWPSDADWFLVGDSDDVAAQMESLQELGVDGIVIRPMTSEHSEQTLRGVADARDQL